MISGRCLLMLLPVCPLQMCILPYLLSAHGTYIYIHVSNYLVSSLSTVAQEQPVCVVKVWAKLVYDVHPALVYSEHIAL